MKSIVLVFYQKGMYDQSAIAIKDFFDKKVNDCDVVMVEEDSFSYCYSSRVSKGFYKFTARNLPLFNRFVKGFRNKTKKKDNKKPISPEQEHTTEQNEKTKFKRIENVLKRFCPNAVLCLTPKSHDLTIKARATLKMDMPIYALMTDYCLNPMFINDLSDGYLVQNEFLGQALQTKGVDGHKIFITGTPIKMVNRDIDVEQVRKKYGIENDLPVVTIVGGRYGCDYVKNAFTVLVDYYQSLNLVVVTSGSNSIENYVKTVCKSKGINENVILVSEPEDMYELYGITKVLVSSPTAGVTYEAMDLCLPTVLIQPMNIIEKGNYSFLTSNRIALCGASKQELITSTLNLLNNDDVYEDKVAELKELRADVTPQVVEFLVEKANKNNKTLVVEEKLEEEKEEKVEQVEESSHPQTKKKKNKKDK